VKSIDSAIRATGISVASRIARNQPSGGRAFTLALRNGRSCRSNSSLALSRSIFTIVSIPFRAQLHSQENRGKQQVFPRVALVFGSIKSILTKHRVILCNLLPQFATLFAANSQIQVAQKVNLSNFCNHLGEHLQQIATI
jgi:hypothetical protein